MSHHWGLRCVKCKCTRGRVNHGEKIWRDVIRLWPTMKPLAIALRDEKDWPWELEVNIYVSGDSANRGGSSLLPWLLEHADHGIELLSEYYREEEPNKDPPILLLPPKAPTTSPSSQRGKRIWSEDDCTVHDPDHETLHKAWKRLFDEDFDARLATDYEDFGDGTYYTMPNGYSVFASYPGASEIYAPAAPDVPSNVPLPPPLPLPTHD